MVMRLV
jgi:hypothetical protein